MRAGLIVSERANRKEYAGRSEFRALNGHLKSEEERQVTQYEGAAWRRPMARRAHNPKVVSSNLTPATILRSIGRTQASGLFLFVGLRGRKIRAVSS